MDGVAADLRAQRACTGGDRVSIWMSNRVEAIVMFLACAREGIACNPSLHRTFTCGEIGTLLERLSARALLSEPGWGADRAHVDFDKVLAGCRLARGRLHAGHHAGAGCERQPRRASDPDKVAYLAFTSGTTGAPKCVMHSRQHAAGQRPRHGARLEP